MAARVRVRALSLAFLMVLILYGSLEFSVPATHVEARSANRAAQQEEDPTLPCAPRWSRDYDSLVAAPGDTIEVEVWFDFHCQPTAPKTNLMLVINTSVSDESNRQAVERNMRTSLQELVSQLNFGVGDSIGLVTYDAKAQLVIPLGGDIVSGISRIRFKVGTSAGMDEAIGMAFRQLPPSSAGADVRNVLLVFDTGTQPGEPGTACALARRQDAAIIGVQLPFAGGRLGACVNEGLYTAADDDGTNLPDLFKAIGRSLRLQASIEDIIVTEYLDVDVAEYVQGSASRPPDNIIHFVDFDWSFEASGHPPGGQGQSLTYQLRIVDDEELAPSIQRLSSSYPEIMFRYTSRAGLERRDLANPEVCVHRPNHREEDCGDFLTAEAAAPTETAAAIATQTAESRPTSTATPEPSSTATATSTPSESATLTPESSPAPCEGCVYLPILAQSDPA